MDNTDKYKCPSCGSVDGPCNMVNPILDGETHIRLAGHCADCGYSFTRIYELHLLDTINRK